MNAWIVYDSTRYLKNKTFAFYLKEAFKKHHISAEIKIINHVNEIKNVVLPQIVVMRCVNLELSVFFEDHQVKLYNSSFVSRIVNDKFQTYAYLSSLNIFMAYSELIYKDNYRQNKIPFPKIIKTIDGHGGNEVFMAHSIEDIESVFQKTKKEKLLCQEIVSLEGKDVRVYVLGKQIICAMQRFSNSNDFRSNFSLGGTATIYHLTEKERNQVEEIVQYFDFGLVGIDFILKDNQFVLNEIEDVVGCRMLYQYTDIDIANLYVDFIVKKNK